jgi:hypothetical protein
MPVIVRDKRAKGYQGDIREVHEIYIGNKDALPFKNIKEDIQHQCVAGCKACRAMLPKGHICIIACRRCRLDKLPNYELEDGGLVDLKSVQVDVYIYAQSSIRQFDMEYIRPSE